MDQNTESTIGNWHERPADVQFNGLDSLYDATYERAHNAQVDVIPNKHIEVFGQITGSGEREIGVTTHTDRFGWTPLEPTHWSFGQLCQRAEVPAHFARKTHPEIAALAMNYGLAYGDSTSDQSMIMVLKEDEYLKMHCMTSPSYGRIYDYEVCDMTRRIVNRSDQNWVMPWTLSRNVHQGTGAYSSDRDLNIFLTDSEHPLSVMGRNGEHRMMYRGVMIGNSEVGSASFSVKTFLYDSYCSNRMIFGMQGERTLRIRHTSGAPDRFLLEGAPLLKAYAESSPEQEEKLLAKATQIKVGDSEDSVRDWLTKRNFNVGQANAVIRRAREEEGEIPRTLWDVVQTGTAMARNIKHTDSRVKEEAKFGKLLKIAEER